MTQLGQIALIPGAEVDIREPDRDCYGTPWSFVEDVKRRFGPIELDVCCLEGTAKAPRFYTPQDDGLSKPWNARLWWCNPPYSDIEPWVLKGIDELDHNPKSFAGLYLVPSGRAGQPWQRMLRQRGFPAEDQEALLHVAAGLHPRRRHEADAARARELDDDGGAPRLRLRASRSSVHPHRSERRLPARFSRRTSMSRTWTNSQGVPQTTSWSSKRDLSVTEAIKRLREQLGRMDARHTVISTNVPTRNDGLPYSSAREPDDPGVALYFHRGGKPYCFPCDRWDRVADNIAAIAAHLDAMRGMERWGVGTSDQAFAGWLALPPGQVVEDWRAVFQLPPDWEGDLSQVRASYRLAASFAHPDKGGSEEAMTRLNRAMDAAKVELGRFDKGAARG